MAGRRIVRRGLCVVVALVLLAAVPVGAEDNNPGGGGLSACKIDYNPDGVEVPSGGVWTFPPGYPVPGTGGTTGGTYMCINGQWILIIPIMGPNGPILMAGLPNVASDLDPAELTVDEGSIATMTGTWSYDSDLTVEFSASMGTVTKTEYTPQLGAWSWSYDTTDGPATSTVSIFAKAGNLIRQFDFPLTVENVAPTVTSVTPDRSTALVGETVSFAAAASDPSADDTTAGFTFAFDGIDAASPYSVVLSECGATTVDVTATDRDGGMSDIVTSEPVTAIAGTFAAPLEAGAYNLVRAGQVVPVRVSLGCSGAQAVDLAPTISLVSGDIDPATSSGDDAQAVAGTLEAPDSGGVMQLAGNSYLYNLRVPKAPVGSTFTIKVEPFADGGATLYAVLQLR